MPIREITLASLAIAACAAAIAAHAQNAAALYESACAACHGSDGRGQSQAQLAFATPTPDFTDCDFAAREPDLDWTAVIHDGGPARGFDRIMPAFGDALSDAEIRATLEHVRSFCTSSDWPRGDLNLPRTLFTEKAFPEDEAVIESTLDTVGDDSLTFTFLWEQRFGTRNQMEISLPVTRSHFGAAGWASGAGDLAVGVKHVLRHSYERGSILSIGGEVVLPTGDEARGFGKGTTVLEPYVAFGKILPRDGFVQVQAKAELPSSSQHNDELAIRGAYGRTWTAGGPYGRSWTPIIEVLGARERTSGAETQWDLVPQLQVTLNRRQHVIANAGFRVPVSNRSERDVEFVMYLLWDWFDGGVLEGW